MTHTKRFIVVLSLAFVGLAACGKRGDPYYQPAPEEPAAPTYTYPPKY